MAVPSNPPHAALLEPPRDGLVPIPAEPTSPPTVGDVIGAIRYRQDVDVSISQRHPDLGCDLNDRYNGVIYEHTVIAQAAAATGPQAVAPPWVAQLQIDIMNGTRQVLRTEILPELRRQTNHTRGTGNIMPFAIIPFTNGDDPTLPPHNLPPLYSIGVIEGLNEHDLATYLTHYDVVPIPAGAAAGREALKRLIGASD
ncbi:hypothetical protein EDB92DRAFT_653866 [Lactarius akahatsu]|uniref:Mug135-like C-terminal domain-containing protein n=1 Tax=Lactarius akahatsu TaxID=416441 RepID=A0AAD4Q7C2_9AGAM|nr:hypothetical protein EDB92DRAFT_653866 [Lactarius akahatsu]